MANHPDYLQAWEIEHSYSRREHYAIKSAGRRGRLYGAPGKITLADPILYQISSRCAASAIT